MNASSRPITELIADSTSADLRTAAPAGRELLERHVECIDHIPAILRNLHNSNAALADFAFRTLERIGDPAIPLIVRELDTASGRYRTDLLALVSFAADFQVAFPILKNEIENGTEPCRYWAANCLCRRYNAKEQWTGDARATLDKCVEMLLATRFDSTIREYWSQARMTLKHLGVIPNDAL